MTAVAWPPPATGGDDIADLRHGLAHVFGPDTAHWDPEIRELLELAQVTREVAT